MHLCMHHCLVPPLHAVTASCHVGSTSEQAGGILSPVERITLNLVQRSGIQRRRYDITLEARLNEAGVMAVTVALADGSQPRVVSEMVFAVDAGLIEIHRGDGFDSRHGFKAGDDDRCRVCDRPRGHICHNLKDMVR